MSALEAWISPTGANGVVLARLADGIITGKACRNEPFPDAAREARNTRGSGSIGQLVFTTRSPGSTLARIPNVTRPLTLPANLYEFTSGVDGVVSLREA